MQPVMRSSMKPIGRRAGGCDRDWGAVEGRLYTEVSGELENVKERIKSDVIRSVC